MRNRWLKNSFTLVLALVLCLALLEGLFRCYFGQTYAKRAPFYQSDADLGWMPHPDLDDTFYGPDFSMRIRTDGFGMRLGKLGPVPKDADRVLLLGDSFAFGWGVNTDQTMASYLDESLYASCGLRLENLGVNGYGTLQVVERVKTYFRTHDPAKVRAVVLLHCPNDPMDNVIYMLVRLGLRQVNFESVNMSWSHLLNFINRTEYMNLAISTDSSKQQSEPRQAGQTLFAFPVKMAKGETPTIDVNGKSYSLSHDEYDLGIRRSALSPLQEALLEKSLRELQCEVLPHVPVIHVVTYDSNWYAAAVQQVAQRAGAVCGADMTFAGELPMDGYTGKIYNEHSGLHYTPELNAFYAHELQDLLQRAGVCPVRTQGAASQ